MTNTVWLSASNIDGRVTIHGNGYFDKGSLETPIKDPTPEKVCQFYVADAPAHGNTVVLTPDVRGFIELVNKFLK